MNIKTAFTLGLLAIGTTVWAQCDYEPSDKLVKLIEKAQDKKKYDSDKRYEFFQDALEMDMFISGNGYYLPNVPCRLVYDVRTKKAMTFMIGLEYRRCGLQFARLSEKQMDQLEYYLTHHTAGGE